MNESNGIDSKQKLRAPKDYFKKTVLAAEIVYQLHDEPTFGHIKFAKLFCLCEHVNNIKLSTNYKKFAAGPLDNKWLYSVDSEFEKQKWFKKVQREGSYGVKYLPLENVEKYKDYYSHYFSNQATRISSIIELFRKRDTAFCEIVATLFFVWEEAIEKNQ
ncbi:MAG: hypothetical protein IPP51_07460 [Bacteroidetes bacterium]|nr:hypothetical protein [Bacteroidota bacterium]